MFGADSITGGAYVDPVQLKWLSADNALQEGTATAGGLLATDLQQEEGISGLLAATPHTQRHAPHDRYSARAPGVVA